MDGSGTHVSDSGRGLEKFVIETALNLKKYLFIARGNFAYIHKQLNRGQKLNNV
jgi:hypothetical protein